MKQLMAVNGIQEQSSSIAEKAANAAQILRQIKRVTGYGIALEK